MSLAGRLFPYIANRQETPEQQIARLRAELAVIAGAEPVHANDNTRPAARYWWHEDNTPA